MGVNAQVNSEDLHVNLLKLTYQKFYLREFYLFKINFNNK